MIKDLQKPKRKKAGVYQFFNGTEIIYIGSSKNLYERVRSYNNTDIKKNALINAETTKIHYIYTDDYKAEEVKLIQEHQPKFNIKSKSAEVYLKRNKKYMDSLLVEKVIPYSDIILIGTKKGTGKTTEEIRKMINKFFVNGKPSAYVRATIEQLEEFVQDDKFIQILKVLNFPLSKDIVVTRKGMFKLVYSKKSKKKLKQPIIYFLSINEAMKIQSSKFQKMNYIVFDEIQNHFVYTRTETTFNKFVNLVSSVLREESPAVIMLFNKVNNNDLFLQKFKLDKQIQHIKKGAIKRFKRVFYSDDRKKHVVIYFAIYNPFESLALRKSQEKSIGYKLSFLSEYGSVINSDDFYITGNEIKYIDRLGDFDGIINFNGHRIGLWRSKESDTLQFSSKYNQTGKEYYINITDYSIYANLIAQDFDLNIKNRLLHKSIEFENAEIFGLVIAMIDKINLWKNEKRKDII